jgi:hypothetical protein
LGSFRGLITTIQINLTGIAACLTDEAGGDLRELEEQLKSLLLAHSNLRLLEVEFVQEDMEGEKE